MDRAPQPKKATLCQPPLDQRRSVDALQMWMRDASYVLPGLSQSQEPMQVNAVGDSGKGNKGKGKHSKGKGRDKNKNKNGDCGKGLDRDSNWNAEQQAAQLQGYCSHCAKWSHIPFAQKLLHAVHFVLSN